MMWRIRAALAGLLLMSGPVAAHNVQTIPAEPVVKAGLSLSWRSAAVGEQGVWRIPGALMGGHAQPTERGLTLDDANVTLFFPFDPALYVAGKLATHDESDSSVALEEALLGWHGRFDSLPAIRWRAEAGRMMPRFLPELAEHASERRFSDAALSLDVFFGRQIHDEGVRLWWEHDTGWSVGAEVWRGSAFPATPGRDGGAADVFVQWSRSHGGWDWRVGAWYVQADAKQRADERYSEGGHSHAPSAVTSDITDIRFTGRTHIAGLEGAVSRRLTNTQQVNLQVNWLTQQVQGDISDTTRLAELEAEAQGRWISVAWQSGQHELAVRWENVVLENTLSGAAASVLADAANLVNDGHEPARTTVQWRYRVRPELHWHVAWIADNSLPERRQQALIGLMWHWQK